MLWVEQMFGLMPSELENVDWNPSPQRRGDVPASQIHPHITAGIADNSPWNFGFNPVPGALTFTESRPLSPRSRASL